LNNTMSVGGPAGEGEPMPADEAARYLDTAQAAKQTATVAALALIQAAGDADEALKALGEMRGVVGEDFAGDVISIARQAIREAVVQARG
jgi:hypothetical protein